MLRAIHLFPKFPNLDKIEKVREKYDSLYGLIPPHITLVFPFESDLSRADLHTHFVACVDKVSPFKLCVNGITATSDNYLFLNVTEGADEIIDLHDRLYTGILRGFLNEQITYTPHITVGRFADTAALEHALAATQHFSETFECLVTEITTEIIKDDQSSVIEFTVPFGINDIAK
ncbi:2'-5' RNA ligase family protein [Brevibacillus fluminis]|uniref:2'-5' RNA ligase family protein n=1 Tax=Brevibacillus fluminis TaxID=511487 RepID=UPI003F8A3F1F